MSNDLKAYMVREGDDGQCVIVFAANGEAARREGGNELDLSFKEVESCGRAPWADEYAPGPVPMHAYLANGWWFECAHCGVKFDDEGRRGEEDNGREDEFEPVEDGGMQYCSPTCKMGHWAERRAEFACECATIEVAAMKWPEATSLSAGRYSKAHRSGEYEWRARFMLPGLQYPVSWVPGEETVSVSRCDADEFTRLYGVKEAA